MNKKFEAVPVDEWIETDPAKGRYNVLLLNGDTSFDFFDNDFNEWFTGERPTHVLVPVEDEWVSEKQKRLDYLESLINNPEIEDFLEGVKLEAAHQTERWGVEYEENKYPHDYTLVMDKLKGKQAIAIWDKDSEKYKHHLITLAAVCFNAHRQIKKEGTRMNKFFTPTPITN